MELASERLPAGEPVISVDTKEQELIGEYANRGREWHPAGEPTRVNVHDFADRELGEFAKAIPCGIYDLGNDEGWVSVGDSADTAEFAVESIRRWWNTLGTSRLPEATRLMITADSGRSNGYRVRAWKLHLANARLRVTCADLFRHRRHVQSEVEGQRVAAALQK